MKAPSLINVEFTARAAFWVLIYWFLAAYLHPELILADSIPTGGDMASHYPSAVYLKEYLLPHGRLVGWQPGNYAGFPQFQLYFPLPFLLMTALSLVMPLTVAFKIVSVSGILALPLAARRFFQDLGYGPGAQRTAALFTLPFLFMEANSAWGGNIPSTLAGEFTYSIGLSLSLVYLGRMYRHAPQGSRAGANALLLAAVGLCHGYTLLFCVVGSSFFLITTRNWTARLIYLLKVNILAFCLMGFWILPLLAFMPHTTPFNFVWTIHGWRVLLPAVLWPCAALGAVEAGRSLLVRKPEDADSLRGRFFLYLILISAVYYFIAFKIGVVDIRFLPFGQILTVLLGAAFAGRYLAKARAGGLVLLALALAVVPWTAGHEHVIGQWAAWNYSGVEKKPLWPAFKAVNQHLRGTFADPRVVYEHSERTNAAGTVRAFESLPFFSGRATLEGAYIQAGPSSPLVFYIQSEFSPSISAPLRQINYSRFDPRAGLRHLKLFNVGHYITVTEEAGETTAATPGFTLEKRFPPFTVFRVDGPHRYVTQPAFWPVLALSDHGRRDVFAWFRWTDTGVPLVPARRAAPEERGLFAAVLHPGELPEAVRRLPRVPLPPNPDLEETIHNEEIFIRNAVPGRPLWIKVSYHPNWKVEGAERVWQAGTFMLVFPTRETVRLYFGRSWPDYAGLVLTVLGCLCLLLTLGLKRRRRPVPPETPDAGKSRAGAAHPRAGPVLRLSLAVAAGLVLWMVAALSYEDPVVYFNRGRRHYDAGDFERAASAFRETRQRFPLSPVTDQAVHHLALCDYRRERYDRALEVWKRLERDFPESRVLPEAFYHIGLCYLKTGAHLAAEGEFGALAARFPRTRWADEAMLRIRDMTRQGLIRE